jgi:hypothetical protein
MKTKRFLLGLAFFAMGVVFTFGIQSNIHHHNFNHQAGARKSTIIEVGAPLTVSELKHLGLF